MRPILFSGPMVRAILDGRKTQTRRVIIDAYKTRRPDGVKLLPELLLKIGAGSACPYGAPGDRLYVRETFRLVYDPATCLEGAKAIDYRADGADRIMDKVGKSKWRPSIFMPRWASRLTLEITEVRVQRLQDINEDDAKAEGVAAFGKSGLWRNYRVPMADTYLGFDTAKSSYETLWDSINAKRGFGWEVNPGVWVVTFKRIENEA